MLDRFDEQDLQQERERSVRKGDDAARVHEREVPVPQAAMADVINRWLDGDIPEPVGLRGDAARSVEFWRRLGAATTERRRVVTPAELPSRILAALPPLASTLQVVPWYRKDVRLSPLSAMAAAAALFSLGALAARALLR